MYKNFALFLTLMFLTIFLIGGCSAPPKLDTQSGRPEILFQSVHVTIDDLSSILINYYLDKGYQITKRNNAQVVMVSPIKDGGFFSRYKLELTFNFISTRNQLRVVGQVKKLSLPTFTGTSITGRVDVAPGGPIGRRIQKDLEAIKDRLVNEQAFKGIEKGSGNNASDTGTN